MAAILAILGKLLGGVVQRLIGELLFTRQVKTEEKTVYATAERPPARIVGAGSLLDRIDARV